MRYFTIIAILFIGLWNFGVSEDKDDNNGVVNVFPQDCVEYAGYFRLPNLNIGIQFWNKCPRPMYIAVCANTGLGRFEYHKSLVKVSPYRFYKVFLDTNTEPRSISFTYDPIDPLVPGECASAL